MNFEDWVNVLFYGVCGAMCVPALVIFLKNFLAPTEEEMNAKRRLEGEKALEEDRRVWPQYEGDEERYLREYLMPRYCPELLNTELSVMSLMFVVLGAQFRRYGVDAYRLIPGTVLMSVWRDMDAEWIMLETDPTKQCKISNDMVEYLSEPKAGLDTDGQREIWYRSVPELIDGAVMVCITKVEGHPTTELSPAPNTHEPAAPDQYDHHAAAAGTVLFGPMGATLGDIAARNREQNGRS